MTNDHDGRVRPGGQSLEYGSWVTDGFCVDDGHDGAVGREVGGQGLEYGSRLTDGFCVANDHDGAVGREAVDHQGSRLGSEAADGVYTSIVFGWEYVSRRMIVTIGGITHFNSVTRQTLGIVPVYIGVSITFLRCEPIYTTKSWRRQ